MRDNRESSPSISVNEKDAPSTEPSQESLAPMINFAEARAGILARQEAAPLRMAAGAEGLSRAVSPQCNDSCKIGGVGGGGMNFDPRSPRDPYRGQPDSGPGRAPDSEDGRRFLEMLRRPKAESDEPSPDGFDPQIIVQMGLARSMYNHWTQLRRATEGSGDSSGSSTANAQSDSAPKFGERVEMTTLTIVIEEGGTPRTISVPVPTAIKEAIVKELGRDPDYQDQRALGDAYKTALAMHNAAMEAIRSIRT